ncbi:hypothetical protein DP140_26980, partial [Salmonella enterica subsp. enterica serovar Weltevreden]
ITSCIVLVPRLSAVPQELTCTRNCYFGGLTLREDLPGRFFTTIPLTPEQRIRELEEQLELANQKAEFFESVINVLKNDYGVS